MNRDYTKTMGAGWEPQTVADAPDNPFSLFEQWFNDARANETVDYNAMALATVDADGMPSCRMVLLKDYDENGFVFYTNRDSRKGRALTANPVAALLFYWKSLGRQVRVEGTVTPVPDEESDEYYASRPRGSRIGAWASEQSRPLPARQVLQDRVREYDDSFSGDAIPRPPHWGGYRVTPQRIEFWHEGLYRLHARVLYTSAGDIWTREMLYP
jgi:pyridoxamine 5'-phosphate oxidase